MMKLYHTYMLTIFIKEKIGMLSIWADDGYCRHYYCMLCRGLYPKDWAWRMRPSQRCECRESVGSIYEEEAY